MKDALHTLVTEWDQYLHMKGESYWKIEGKVEPQAFFEYLPKIFPYGMTLLVEGLEMGLTAKCWYEEHSAIYQRNVACDTLDPVPESYHVAFGSKFAEGLLQIITSQGLERALDHIKGYGHDEILFQFHHTFDGELFISSSVSETAVKEFAQALGCVAHAKKTFNQLEHLRLIDHAMNPPWWRRWWRILHRP